MPPKRGSTVNTDASAPMRKRARTSSAHAAAKALVADIVDASGDYELPNNNDEVITTVQQLARYARHLEEQLELADKAATQVPAGPAKKTPEELAEKIRKAAAAGIKKQMSWKPSCKTNSAKWVYDGICPDPEVFGHLFNLGGPPKWKMKKFSKQEFEDIFGDIEGHARYNELYITNREINVRWSETGEFKLSGTYGISM
ncbi:uncharacterized protein PHACADRAFT_210252 [Phanerochaete carnosa HHB-10118-sp]|uniref:Uncharacterized protein n=1 Tax=Phanerochaete carnosa (strain HHB-10118-sp) TaxID=650164 RepID=K5WVI5_PHACS|nr:uncharacterized protein PHACADRAFT_210252 [Phanerochaete carnosa HHB-10118-sp]EKM54452.1 hypothetical protein PHACADRAFT_210252 [Phanerochaete carnosa HHB-10118-sp]